MTDDPELGFALDDLGWLRALAARLAAPGDGEDLVQDTLIASWLHRPRECQDAAQHESARPWLATVLRNRARMNTRARVRR